MARRISEDDLLAFIEGDLPDERQAEIRRALEGEPDLLAWVEGAGADRAALREWGRPGASIAPPDLVEQAMRQAERDALLGAAGLDDSPRPRVLFRFTGPRTALAAMLLAAIGLGFLYGPTLVQQWRAGAPAPRSESPRAEAPAGGAEEFAEPEAQMARRAEGEGERLAAAPSAEAGASGAPFELRERISDDFKSVDAELGKTTRADAPVDANGVPMQFALAPAEVDALADGAGAYRDEGAAAALRAIGQERDGADVAPSLSLEEAANLARLRRLIVRIEAPGAAGVADALRADGERRFRVSSLTDGADEAPLRLLVETPPGADGLSALLHALGGLGASSVRMGERGGALPAPAPADATDVLWWTQPAGSWPGMGSAVELEIVELPALPPLIPGD